MYPRNQLLLLLLLLRLRSPCVYCCCYCWEWWKLGLAAQLRGHFLSCFRHHEPQLPSLVLLAAVWPAAVLLLQLWLLAVLPLLLPHQPQLLCPPPLAPPLLLLLLLCLALCPRGEVALSLPRVLLT